MTNQLNLWLADRQQSIGGSDAPAILNESRFSTPLKVYYSKRGLTDPKPMDQERLELGLAFEPVIADMARRRCGPDYEVIEGAEDMAAALNDESLEWAVYSFRAEGSHFDASQIVVRRKGFPHVHATPDALVRHRESGKLWVAEWKAGSEYMVGEWEEGTPSYYQTQGKHNAAVMGLDGCFVGVVLGTAKFRTDFVPGFGDAAGYLAKTSDWYKAHVLADFEPEAVAADDASPSFLGHIYKDKAAETVALDHDAMEDDERYAEILAIKKPMDAEYDAIRARMKQRIGANKGGVLSNGVSWRYKGRGIQRFEAEK